MVWHGPLPMIRLMMALVHSDKIRSAYMKRNDISNERIVLDNQKSVEKRATTVWELLSSLWNDANFSPVTEYINDLQSDFMRPISIPHSRVSTLSPATPDKVQEKISTMTVCLQQIIQKWQLSGQGDSGIDINDNEDKVFGLLDNHPCGALNTRLAFLGNNPSYLLYLWEMLHKYQLFSTAFCEFDKKMSAKNGGKGVPSAINNLVLFECDVDNEWELSDTGSTLASSGKKQSSSSRKSDSSTKKISSKSNNSDFSQGFEQLAESNIIAARMDLGSLIRTNILSLEAELGGYDMALTDEPHPRKKAKLEEQMATVQVEINKLKAGLSRNVSTPPQSNFYQSPADRSEGSMQG
jgi:hypothetical protein